MPTVTAIPVSVDTLFSQILPDKNYGAAAELTVNADPNGRGGLLFWDQPFPPGVTIRSASVTIKQRGASTGGSRTVTLQRASSKWEESTVTYNTRPAGTGTSATVTLGNGPDLREWTFNAQAMMQAVADGAPWYGFRLTSSNTTIMRFYPREAGPTLAATMSVTWDEVPEQPVGLSPAGGRSVSVPRPLLRFGGESVDDLTAIQVQRHTSNSWTAPTFDSGEVASSTAEFTPPADLPSGADIWWRARVKDGSGLWSPWSAGAVFRRTAKPSVTITSPSTFYTFSPTFAWTVSGGTQVSYQLSIVPADDTSNILWTSGKITSPVGSVTLPAGFERVLRIGSSYRLILRVWDTVARETIPNDPAYVEVLQTFTVGTSGDIAPVTGLAWTPTEDDAPFVTLTWSRSSAPGEFWVLIDGALSMILDPSDLSAGGTNYSLELRSLPLRKTVDITIVAASGLQASEPRTVEVFVVATGVWVYSLTPGGPAFVMADSDVSIETTESTAVFEPPGAQNVVLITQRRGVVRGGAKGMIRPGHLSDWEALSALRGTTMGMSRIDLAFPVRIWDTLRDNQNEGVAWKGDDSIPVQFSYAEHR